VAAPPSAASIPAAAGARGAASAGPRLSGPVLARAAWLVWAVLALLVVAVVVPARYRRVSAPPEVVQTSLAQFGISVEAYAACLIMIQVVFSLELLSGLVEIAAEARSGEAKSGVTFRLINT
jgi:hypothetical protein